MKHLTTLLTMAITITGLGQQMPYNPDANGDDFVGVDDVLGVLGVYDTALMQPDLQCDYNGTDLEQLFGGLFAETLVLDSIYVEYLIVDSVTTYLPECPDPVVVETVLERSYTLIWSWTSILDNPQPVIEFYGQFLGYWREITFRYNSENGQFQLQWRDEEVGNLTSFDSSGYLQDVIQHECCTVATLPFPAHWGLNENGIGVDWNDWGWVHNCQSFRLIPFWHEAE